MSHTAMVALPSFTIVRSAANRPRQKLKTKTQELSNQDKTATDSIAITARRSSSNSNHGFGKKKKEPLWQCIQNCGACCKLDKGPTFPSPEEIFDDPADVEVSFLNRPYFCRVEPDIFQTLYGIDKKKFNKEACSCCIDTIKAVYGSKSEELNNFNHAIWNKSPK